ncbi:MAG: ribonuclease domain-containing protein [Saprospiraceae bacterium]
MQRPSPKKRLIARLLILAALAIIGCFVWYIKQPKQNLNPEGPSTTSEQGTSQVHANVLEVLQFIRRNGHAPDGFVGGREFQNREKQLPAKDSKNKRIRYSEWDVHPKIQGQNRGPERLVTGSDHSAYFTKDHYKTFVKIE